MAVVLLALMALSFLFWPGGASWEVIYGSCQVNGTCISSVNFPDHYPNNDECTFELLQDPTQLLAMEVIEFSTEGYFDRLTVNGVSYSGSDGPHGVIPSGTIQWSSDAIVTRMGWMICLGEAELHDLSCDFEEDGCFWYSQGSSEWQRTKGSASDGSWCLEASANVSADGSFILESARFVPSNGTAMFFTYQLIGSNSSITLQGQVGDGNWTRIFAQMSGGNDSWQAGTVRVPSGTVSLRFLASITDAEAIVRVDSIQLVSASAASSLADVTCNFEVDLCGWSKRWYSWELLSGYLRTQFRTYSDEVLKLTSPLVGADSTARRLYFSYRFYMATVLLEAVTANGWTPLWSTVGLRGDDDWKLAWVAMPPDAVLLRFVVAAPIPPPTGQVVELDAIGIGAPTVDFMQLDCQFVHSCLWLSSCGRTWQTSEDSWSWSFSAPGKLSANQTCILESARFNATASRLLRFTYQLVGSGASLALQSQVEPDDWITISSQTGDASNSLRTDYIAIPNGTVGLRFLASVTASDDVVRVESILAVLALVQDVSCGFEAGDCGWKNRWLESDGWSSWWLYGLSSFTNIQYVYERVYEAFKGSGFMVANVRNQDGVTLTSRPFLPTSSEGFVQFAYSLRSHGGRLELQFELGGIWRRMWRQVGFQTDAWQQVKITLPAGTQRLRFVAGSNAHEKGVDEILAWQPEGPAEFLSLCSGPYHSCAAHVATGDVRCWPWIGTSPDQTDNNLPVIDLGGGRARQVACGQAHNCAVLWDGSLQCWGYYDGHLGNDEIMAVEQVVCGYGFTCALLRGGAVRCFGQLYGNELDPSVAVDLGTDFTVVQLAAGSRHICALSSQGATKCWGYGPGVGLGLQPQISFGLSSSETGENLPSLDLGRPAVQISAGNEYSCAVCSDGSVRCWGSNRYGQLGHGNTVEQPMVNSTLPETALGTGMIALRIAVREYHSCAILQDESMKCWGRGLSGQLGQGSTEDLGDEPSEMGDFLLPINFASLRVRHVSVGLDFTCALLEDDAVRCWGGNLYGQLGIGSRFPVGLRQSDMGAALVAADLFVVVPGESLEDLRLVGGTDRSGLLWIKYNGSFGLVCSDLWKDASARVACRQLGLAGGRAFSVDAGNGSIFADNLVCMGNEASLRDCGFRGWFMHDCTPQDAAGVECAVDAWSELTSAGPTARQDHSMIWDAAEESALVFGGQAATAFLYFDDLWRYSRPLNSWTQVLVEGPGPGPRHGHTAVWDSNSRSMLVFGGKLLGNAFSELWQFACNSESWQQLIPSTELRRRAYHSAAWDEGGRTMLVFGGDDNEVLGDLQLYNVAQNLWIASTAQGPGPRMRHTAVWDDVTDAMLVLGGWDGQRYLSDLWRYDRWAGSWAELSAGPLPRAGHGAAWDPVSLSMLVFGGVQNASGNRSYDHALYNYSLLSGWTELPTDPSLPSPSGRSDMTMVWDSAARGLFLFGGFNSSFLRDTWRYVVSQKVAPPILRCQLGQSCRLDIEVPVTVKASCSDSEVMEDVLQGTDAPRLRLSDPGTYRLCQCGQAWSCSHPADFSGDFSFFIAEGPFANQSATCFMGSPCRVSTWQGVGITVQDKLVLRKSCRTAEASAYDGAAIQVLFQSGSFALDLGSLNAAGKPEVMELCWCPASRSCNTAEDFGTVAVELHITCPPGQYEIEAACEPCPADRYCPGGASMLSCPSGSSAAVGSSELAQCQCLQGRFWSPESSSCVTCPYGSTTAQAGATSLASCSCLPNFVNMDPNNRASCECGPGFGFEVPPGICEACPKGRYKTGAGNSPCSTCQPEQKWTLQVASKSEKDCVCRPGFSLEGSMCMDCQPNFFCNGTGVAFACSDGATSAPSTRSQEECECEAGRFKEGASCTLCPNGRYKPYAGNEGSCPLQCPTSSTSDNGSIDLSNCSCVSGFYAELVGSSLDRCVSCGKPSELRCPGGFRDSTAEHQPPVATPGHFQTRSTVTYRCNALQSNGKSTCLGENECAEGSMGFLCGECLPNWARPGFQAPCEPCEDSTLLLIMSILLDVSSKAAISFVVASMAATAAVRHSSKLHTIMLRITTHWLAVCSVITTFDLSQITALFSDEQNEDAQRGASLAWPEEISTAMRRLFDELSLTPALVSLDFSVQCAAQGMSPDDPVAPRVALGLYHLVLPILVTMSVILLSWLAVNALVPLAARCGFCFNEAGKQHQALEKWQRRLHEAAAVVLQRAGLASLTWAEVEQSGATRLTLEQLKKAAEKPEAFLCQAIASSQPLMLRACTARAASQEDGQELDFAQMDLRPCLQGQVATQSTDLASMLDEVLKAVSTQQPSWHKQGAALEDLVIAEPAVDVLTILEPGEEPQVVNEGGNNLQGHEKPQEMDGADHELEPLEKLQDMDGDGNELETGQEPEDTAAGDQLNSGPAPFAATAELDEEWDDEATAHAAQGKEKAKTEGTPAPKTKLKAKRVKGKAKAKRKAKKKGKEEDEADKLLQIEPYLRRATQHERRENEEEQPTVKVTAEDLVDEVLGNLDFGLFTAKPHFADLVYQSAPVIWVALVSLWPGLLSNFLRMLWCLPFKEAGRDEDVSRLLPNPDVECWSEAHKPSAALALTGLLIWCLGIPLSLAGRLQTLKDRHAPNNDRRFGYFVQGLEPKFWWWDIIVKRADVGTMMLVTYTSIVQTVVAKLLLFPVLSGFQLALAAWVKPYANDQAELLDTLEVTLTGLRFVLFSSISALLIMKPSVEITHGLAYLLFLMLVVACIYFALHVVAQLLQDAATQTADASCTGAVKRFFVDLVLPLFQEAESEMFQLSWSFDSAKIEAIVPKSQRARLTSFETALHKLRLRAGQMVGGWRTAILRTGPSFQHAVLMKANEEFMALWLQELEQPDLPWHCHGILCVLATAQQALPPLLAKNHLGAVWKHKVDSLTRLEGPFFCSPEDVARSIRRLGQLPRDHAVELVRYVIEKVEEKQRSLQL